MSCEEVWCHVGRCGAMWGGVSVRCLKFLQLIGDIAVI